jgi:multimeric flavodoxin WrbA
MKKEITLGLPEKVKILGISGSPRKDGNTAGMVKFCLEWAEKMGYVETEYLSLADYRIEQCNGCMKCFGFMAPADDPYLCYEFDDDIKVLAPKVGECDGLLIGFPIYALGVPGLVRNFLDKLHHYGPMSFTRHSGAMRWKALAIISQGGQVYGGQEINHVAISALGQGLGMFVTTAWPSIDAPMPSSSFNGGMLTTVDGSTIYGKSAWKKEGTRTVPPAQGSRNERTLKNLGRQLVVAAMTLKLGRKAFEEAQYQEPELVPFTRYSVKPKPGSYVDKLIKEGKVTFVGQEELKARTKGKT